MSLTPESTIALALETINLIAERQDKLARARADMLRELRSELLADIATMLREAAEKIQP